MEIEFEIITQGNIKKLDNGAIINRYSHVIRGAKIGRDCMIGEHVYIGRDAIVGDGTRIQNGVSVVDGVTIGKNCFIGQNVCFNNSHNPALRREREDHEEFIPEKTNIADNVTICANVTITAPCEIKEGSYVGAASIVLRDIKEDEKANGLVKGRGEAEKPKRKRRKKKV
jgi:UDP-2-acetamido-3-amino-2,3-dideoxy-glucuronate N-acetyltransferase